MAYSAYDSINIQLQSSVLGKGTPTPPTSKNVTVEKIEKTLTDTMNQTK